MPRIKHTTTAIVEDEQSIPTEPTTQTTTIEQQPQLSSTAKAFLRNTRRMVVGLKDEGA